MDVSAKPTPADSPSHDQVECPRCGYDQRGEIARWTDSCPLEGLCTECGLTFAWARLYANARHPWLFEHQWRRQPVRSALKTIGMCFRPFRFWHDIELTDRIQLTAPCVLVLFMIGAWCVAGWQLTAAVLWAQVLNNSSWLTMLANRYPSLANADPWIQCQNWAIDVAFPRVLLWLPSLLLWPLLFPVFFVLIPVTLSRNRVRLAHLVRVMLYSTFALFIVGVVVISLETYLRSIQSQWAAHSQKVWWRWRDVLTGCGLIQSTTSTYVADHFIPPWFCVTCAWTVLWWTAASRRYLALSQPTLTMVLLGTAAFLAASLITALMGGLLR